MIGKDQLYDWWDFLVRLFSLGNFLDVTPETRRHCKWKLQLLGRPRPAQGYQYGLKTFLSRLLAVSWWKSAVAQLEHPLVWNSGRPKVLITTSSNGFSYFFGNPLLRNSMDICMWKWAHIGKILEGNSCQDSWSQPQSCGVTAKVTCNSLAAEV